MTTLIKNALVYDGSGAPPTTQDILIRGPYVAKVASVSRENADEVIDATGCIVTPGFIDITTHSDHHMSLLYEPFQEDFVRQGVTTTIGGNCGVSLAPLVGGTLEAVREWGNEHRENIGWRSVREFLSILETRGVGVNFGMLAGHTTIRRGFTKNSFRDLSEGELIAFRKTLAAAMKEGAFGLSVGLEHIHAKKTPFHELRELFAIVARYGGVQAVHLRDSREGVVEALKETLELAEEENANIEISHLQPLEPYAPRYAEAVELIGRASSRHHIHFDVHPFDSVPMLMYELLPEWFHDAYLETMREHLKLTVLRPRLFEHFKKLPMRDIVITHVPDAALKFLEGVSVREYAIRNEQHFEEALLSLMDMTALRATVSAKTVDTALLSSFLAHPSSIIASNSASFGKKEFKPIQSTATFPSFLALASGSKLMAVETAIHKTTGLPAKKYGIAKRGLVKEGYYADLVILAGFKPKTVFINGVRVLSDEHYTPLRAGMVLRKKPNE